MTEQESQDSGRGTDPNRKTSRNDRFLLRYDNRVGNRLMRFTQSLGLFFGANRSCSTESIVSSDASRAFSLICFALCLCGWMGCSGGATPPPTPPTTPGPTVTVKPPEKKYEGPVWFSDAKAVGIDFVHESGISPLRPFPAANGSGLAGLDFDLDGLVDLYFLTGQALPAKPSADSPRNHLYRNLGAWEFEDVSSESRLDLSAYSAGVAVGDYNQDGFPDVYVSCVGKNVFFENMGDGTFAEHPMTVGAENSFPTSAAMFDYNGDGFPDIYVCNYGKWLPEPLFNHPCGTKAKPTYCSPQTVVPAADILLENDGQGGFTDVTKQVGIDEPIGRGQGIIVADMNDDGPIDFYLGNDLNANSFFVNESVDGENGEPRTRFRDITEDSGVAYNNRGVAQAGMGVDAADVDGDGQMDLVVTNFWGEYNSLYINGGDEFYNEQSERWGIASESRPFVGWGVSLTDFNLDTWPDLVVTNGHVDIDPDVGSTDQPPLAWVNNTKGRFRFLGPEAGPFFKTLHQSRGLLTGDFDNDGDQDIVFSNQDAKPELLKNNRIEDDVPAASIKLKLIGTSSSRDVIGADVVVESDGRRQRYQVKGGGSYLTARDTRLVLAANDSADILIRWPNQQASTIENLQAGSEYVVIEPATAEDLVQVFKVKRP